MPYSIVGPFVGTVLDRVSRQRALFFANLARSINLLLVALLVFSGTTGVELTIVVLIAFGVLEKIKQRRPTRFGKHHQSSAPSNAPQAGEIVGGGVSTQQNS